MMQSKESAWGKRGNIAIFAAFSLSILLGFMALVVDMGFAYWVRQQEQTTAEAAAIAAVKELDSTPTGLSNARSAAAVMVSANDPNDTFSFDPDTEVVFGVWDGTAFTPETEALVINAAKVNIIRSADKANAYNPAIAGAVFGANDITISNSAIALATFSETTDVDCGVASKGTLTLSGDVVITGDSCSNGNVGASGSVEVNGDLACGVDSAVTITGNVNISGSTQCLSNELNIPNVTLPANIATTNNNSSATCSSGSFSGCFDLSNRNISLSGQQKLTLPAGTYYVNNISIVGQGEIIITGDVTIYVTGSISAAGKSITTTNSSPDDLQILVASTSGVSFSGTSDFKGHIYAPQSNVSISGTAGYTGSIIGNDVTVSGTPNITVGGTIPVQASTGVAGDVTASLVK